MPELSADSMIAGPIPLPDTRSNEQASAIRLCVFFNVVQTIYYHAIAVGEHQPSGQVGKYVRAGHELIMTLLLTGVLKEGADAMRQFAPQVEKSIKGMANGPIDIKPIEQAWANLKQAIDKDDHKSFWNRQLKRTRDEAAFHWAHGEIETVLKERRTRAPFLIRGAQGDPLISARFLMADEVIARIAFPNYEEINIVRTEICNFVKDVIRVVGIALPAYFLQHGCALEPFTDL